MSKMTDRERLNKLAKCFRDYMSKEGCEPINGYSNQFYDGVLWAFARLTEIYPPYEEESEKAQKMPIDELLDYIRLSIKHSDELKEKYRNKYKESNNQHDLYYSHLFEGMAEAYDDILKKIGERGEQ